MLQPSSLCVMELSINNMERRGLSNKLYCECLSKGKGNVVLVIGFIRRQLSKLTAWMDSFSYQGEGLKEG